MTQFKIFIISILIIMCFGTTSFAQEGSYGIVILNGRIMDPETNFDGVRNVGIKDGKIATITKKI